MAVKLPDGSTLSLANSYATAVTVTAVSNATTAVCTAAAHGLTTGSFVEITSGWSGLNARVFKVGAVTASTFELVGMDTSDTVKYPAGGGIGSVRSILAWTQVQQILDFSTSGGEQKFIDYEFLEDDFGRQMPGSFSAQSLTIGIADDPTLPGYIALKTASDARAIRAMRLSLRDGTNVLYNGYVSLNETPSATKGQVMQVKASLALCSKPVRA